ncbi:MAG: hypothetical protein A3B23_03790 [Candidatus Colwellbacteria bacterium RIFCSPLOWO2_01_FULL_48_10]|uniref:SpoVT-AbrB domain-containing protein n=1 Tax=Candidatus Colwellbacteria bacterium RIFCSPLOWO2_01_FULL_48_10 TaxID=1797690 RepID=A0A1G1Z4C8_9BACT|nr:MAG: hypothetical protein A3B23_03790 [Candidatus Colwellbacteria bacterium RIFCSPLOWO2_01_FULL_48_10]
MNNTKIQKVTERGQITLPAEWRKNYPSSNIMVRQIGDKLEIAPLKIDNNNEYTVFDALRDNKGAGLKTTDLIKVLKKIDR